MTDGGLIVGDDVRVLSLSGALDGTSTSSLRPAGIWGAQSAKHSSVLWEDQAHCLLLMQTRRIRRGTGSTMSLRRNNGYSRWYASTRTPEVG